MADTEIIPVDQYRDERKAYVRDDGAVMKAHRGSPGTWDKTKRTVDFVMSAEVEDRDRDIILQAGLNIDKFVGDNPIALPMHMHRAMPIGKWANVTKNLTGRPKRTEGTLQLVPEGVNAAADEIAQHIDFGTLRACSIGFIPSKVKRRKVPEEKADEPYYYPGYEIEESELLECSVVNIPANPAALAKHAERGNAYARELIEEVLDCWAKHPETGLIIPRAEFEKAAKTASNGAVSVSVSVPEGASADSFLKRFFGGTSTTRPRAEDLDEQSRTKVVVSCAEADEAAAAAEAEKKQKLDDLKKAVEIGMRRREAAKRAAVIEKRVARL
jgi:hypothetical protein